MWRGLPCSQTTNKGEQEQVTQPVELTSTQTGDLVERIVAAAHPERILLFGSAARGDMTPRSDVDVLVVAAEESHRRHTAQAIYRRLLGFSLPVDVVVATPTDLEQYGDTPGLVYRQALREGRIIYAT